MRAISPLIAVIMIMWITVSISVAVAWWLIATTTAVGYGTRFTKLEISRPFTYGRLFFVFIKNYGTSDVTITGLMVNRRYVPVRLAYDPYNPNVSYVYVKPRKEIAITLKPGDIITLWGIMDKPMRAGILYELQIMTSIGYTYKAILEPRIGVDIGSLASVKLIAFYDGSGDTGYNGFMVSFDPVTWRYSFWTLENPTGDPTRGDAFILYGAGDAVGSLEDPPPPKYSGYTPVITDPTALIEDYNKVPTSPLLMVLNLHAKLEDWNFTLYNYPRSDGYRQITKFIMKNLPRAVRALDFILLWEDQWRSPTWTNTPSDWRSWIDHVVRVTWMETREVRIGVYRASGGYLHVFYIGKDFVYYKPHGDTWGDSGYGTSDTVTPGLEDRYVFIEGIHTFAFYEIGYDGGFWIAPSGYNVTVWYITPTRTTTP